MTSAFGEAVERARWSGTFHCPTRVGFGIESLADLAPSGPCFAAVDPGVLDSEPFVELRDLLGSRLLGWWSDVEPNPTAASAYKLVGNMRPGSRWLLAVGGGSSIDTTKLAAAALDGMPIVAIPTTAGSGSEMSEHAIVTGRRGAKQVRIDPRYRPAVAILEPRFVLTAPRHVRAASGLDAVTHAAESLVSARASPWSRVVAAQALRLLTPALPVLTGDAPDLMSASESLLGANLAGAAMGSSGLGPCHSLANPVTRVFGLAHGVAASMFLPAVLDLLAHAGVLPVEMRDMLGEDPGSRVRELLDDLGRPAAGRVAWDGVDAATRSSILEEALANPANDTFPLEVDATVLERVLAGSIG